MFRFPTFSTLKTLPRTKVSGTRGWFAGLCAMFFLVTGNAAQAFDTVIIDPGHGGHDRGAPSDTFLKSTWRWIRHAG